MPRRRASSRALAQAEERLELDAALRRISMEARLLPALVAENGAAERFRLVEAVRRGEMAVPQFATKPRRVDSRAFRLLDEVRRRSCPNRGVLCDTTSALYLARLDELELELFLAESLGDAKRVRPLAARRFGTGARSVEGVSGPVRVGEVAGRMLATVAPTPEPRTLPAEGTHEYMPSLASYIRRTARAAGLEVTVRVEARLTALAATGERVVFIADRVFGEREARRLAVHEVLGHLVAAANARTQPLAIFELGTAGSFADQEGVAIWLEERAGLLDGSRLRMLAARVVATDQMHAGAHFGETARLLVREHGFSAEDAVTLAERAYRGGGVARDAGYLYGWLRVRRAIASGKATIDELRAGRVGAGDIVAMRRLGPLVVKKAAYRPGLRAALRAAGVASAHSIPDDRAMMNDAFVTPAE